VAEKRQFKQLARGDLTVVFAADERFSDPEPRASPVRRRFRPNHCSNESVGTIDIASTSYPAVDTFSNTDECLNASE
jgi:hypothetical protein